jgi:hypothetical protein
MSLRLRHRRWASFLTVLGLVAAASTPVLADCPVPPPPGRFGTVCPWDDGGQGINVVADPGFTVPFPPLGATPNIAHPYEITGGSMGDLNHEYLEGRLLHFGNYRGGCSFGTMQSPTDPCHLSIKQMIDLGIGTCVYDDASNADGLRICSVTDVDGDGSRELRFRITYSAEDGPEPGDRHLEIPALTFMLVRPPPLSQTMGQIGPLPPTPGIDQHMISDAWELPNNSPGESYQIMLRIDDNSCQGWPHLVGETENYILTINPLGVSLKPLGGLKSIPLLDGCGEP